MNFSAYLGMALVFHDFQLGGPKAVYSKAVARVSGAAETKYCFGR